MGIPVANRAKLKISQWYLDAFVERVVAVQHKILFPNIPFCLYKLMVYICKRLFCGAYHGQ